MLHVDVVDGGRSGSGVSASLAAEIGSSPTETNRLWTRDAHGEIEAGPPLARMRLESETMTSTPELSIRRSEEPSASCSPFV
jgi:hypothetical protein